MPDKQIQLIQSNDDIIIVTKPAGVSFHQTNDEPGFVQEVRDALAEELPEPGRIYPVHRLDAVTSGLVVFGRTKNAARELSQAFEQGQVEKRYVALADRKPSKKQGLVVGDMVRSRRGSWRLQRSKKNPARTRLLSVSLADQRPGLRLYLLKPLTGRTHQLRVAMKSLGAPILGDPLYSHSDDASATDRTYLHACGISFMLGTERITAVHAPTEGVEFQSEPFIQAWEALGDIFEAI